MLPPTTLTVKLELDTTLKTYLFAFLSQLLSICVETRDMDVSLSYCNLYEVWCLFEKNVCFRNTQGIPLPIFGVYSKNILFERKKINVAVTTELLLRQCHLSKQKRKTLN